MIRKLVRFVDTRTGTAPLIRKSLRYLFPDHWSFLLGEVALYAFIVLVATGTYLALFYRDSTVQVVYHGGYAPLQAQKMSEASRSVGQSRSTFLKLSRWLRGPLTSPAMIGTRVRSSGRMRSSRPALIMP